MIETWARWRRRLLITAVVIALVVSVGTLGTVWKGRAVPAGPPELVVEGFVQELARHNYSRAMPYLTEHMLAQTIPQTLEVRINDAVEIGTERADVITLGFGLAREAND